MKKLVSLVTLLGILILVWYFLGRQEEARQQGDVPDQATEVDTLTVNRLVLIRYNQPDIVFTKDENGFWNLVQPVADRANPNMVRQIERGLALMKYVNKISDRQSQHASFQIDDIQAARVQAYADDLLQADMYIGNVTPDRQHVYVRPVGSSTVYSATGGGALAALRTRTIDTFRNREIMQSDASLFDSLDVRSADAVYRLIRTDSASWQVSINDGAYQEAKSAVADGVIRAFGQMRASGFLPDTVSLDWSQPALSIHGWMLGSEEEQCDMIKVSDEENYWVRVRERPHVYKVFQSVYKTFIRDPKENLVATEPAS